MVGDFFDKYPGKRNIKRQSKMELNGGEENRSMYGQHFFFSNVLNENAFC